MFDKVPCDKYSCDKEPCGKVKFVMNPTLMQMMERARTVETGERFTARSSRAWGQAAGPLVETPVTIDGALHRSVAPRRMIGLFLVRVGLRLASPRPHAASAR